MRASAFGPNTSQPYLGVIRNCHVKYAAIDRTTIAIVAQSFFMDVPQSSQGREFASLINLPARGLLGFAHVMRALIVFFVFLVSLSCAEEKVWHIKAIHPEGRLLDVKAIDKDGKIHSVKAIQEDDNFHLLDVKALVN